MYILAQVNWFIFFVSSSIPIKPHLNSQMLLNLFNDHACVRGVIKGEQRIKLKGP